MNTITDMLNLAYAKVTFAKADMKDKLRAFRHDARGVTAIEYGLIAALIAVVIIGAVTAVGGDLKETFETISTKVKDANNSAT